MKKLRFKTGDAVKVSATVSSIRKDARKKLVADKCERQGIIVGYTFLQEGDISGGGWEDPRYLAQTDNKFVWKVSFSMRGKPVHVFDENVELLEECQREFSIPRQWTSLEASP